VKEKKPITVIGENLITVKQAASILQRSPSAVYQALKTSPPRLQYADPLRRLIAREGLEERWRRSTRLRVDYKQPTVESTVTAYWELLAQRANEMLDCEAWSAPPWSAHQWAVLVGIAQIAADLD
jgi:hypothetical protein